MSLKSNGRHGRLYANLGERRGGDRGGLPPNVGGIRYARNARPDLKYLLILPTYFRVVGSDVHSCVQFEGLVEVVLVTRKR